MRPVQGAARAARAPRAPTGRAARHVAPAGAGQGPGRSRAQPGSPTCSACPTATRWCSATAARPRSGMPRHLAHRAAQRALRLRRVRRRSSPAPPRRPSLEAPDVRKADAGIAHRTPRCVDGRRRLRVAAQRDLDRRHGAGRAGRGDAGALTVIDATSAAGGVDVDATRVRRLLLRARRRTSRATAASGSRSSPPRPIERVERIAASDRYIPEFLCLKNAVDNSRLEPDAQHPGDRDAAAHGEPARLDERLRRPRLGRRPHPRVVVGALRLGRAHRGRDARSSPTPRTARRWSSRSTSTSRRMPRASPRSCARTASSTPSRTASSAATSCASRPSPRSIPTTCARSPPRSTTCSSRSD